MKTKLILSAREGPRILIGFLSCLLLLPSFSTVATACPPPCPDCYLWNGDGCDWVGCHPPCEDCYDCDATCHCQCTADCGCDGKTCSGCCDCQNCACVPDQSECSGCCQCSSGCSCEDEASECSSAHCEECTNCACVSWCASNQCCSVWLPVGTCVPKCDPDGGDLCTWTDPPVLDPLCAYIHEGSKQCMNPGASCKWKVVSGPARNAVCAPCDPACTLSSTYCVMLEPIVCKDVLSPLPPPNDCECKGTPQMVNYTYAGTRAICP